MPKSDRSGQSPPNRRFCSGDRGPELHAAGLGHRWAGTLPDHHLRCGAPHHSVFFLPCAVAWNCISTSISIFYFDFCLSVSLSLSISLSLYLSLALALSFLFLGMCLCVKGKTKFKLITSGFSRMGRAQRQAQKAFQLRSILPRGPWHCSCLRRHQPGVLQQCAPKSFICVVGSFCS